MKTKGISDCWLGFKNINDEKILNSYQEQLREIVQFGSTPMLETAVRELLAGFSNLLGIKPALHNKPSGNMFLAIGKVIDNPYTKALQSQELDSIGEEGFIARTIESSGRRIVVITGITDQGILSGVFGVLRLLQMEGSIEELHLVSNPKNKWRIINHWDNLDGSIERGYAGRSIFYENDMLTSNRDRIRDYARLLASIGINGIAVNNVNVHKQETRLITDKLDLVICLADIFRQYGIRVFLSINFASPLSLGELHTADPCNRQVAKWWQNITTNIYKKIPDFGGFVVKADSENRPGPFTYNRNQADGANMLAEALRPFGGLLVWRCFVYNCQQDWRDHKTDRAKAAYDSFKPLDGMFLDNVILQIKNGPMDFQVREPVSPLFGGLQETNQFLELQITQEYTGQQRHLCYLVPQWKEILEFDTHAKGAGSFVKRIVDGSIMQRTQCGFAGVVNVGDDPTWTGHILAQANLYGYGRLAWDPDLSAEDITNEWVRLTFGNDESVVTKISQMLLESWSVYENYTSPLGIGWMVNPNHHYGPSVDGYEYSRWGTYHRADYKSIGVDRTVKNGTGYTRQYFPVNAEIYESLETCPDELVLFFHRLLYTYRLRSGKTVLQHIYDSHFDGVGQCRAFKDKWEGLKDKVDAGIYKHVLERLEEQIDHAEEWRDVINSYFYRKSGIPDSQGRRAY